MVTGQCDVPIEKHQGVVINREDLKTSHEEADVIIIQQMNNPVKEGHTGVVVTSDDTDVFVLLIYHYVMLNLSIELIMESPVKDRSRTDIKQTSHKHADIAKTLLAAHALSVCDTVASYHGIGKSKVIKTLKSRMPLQLLGDTTAKMSDIFQESTKFVSSCYGFPNSSDMSSTRRIVWACKVARSTIAMPVQASLPPPQNHLLRM